MGGSTGACPSRSSSAARSSTQPAGLPPSPQTSRAASAPACPVPPSAERSARSAEPSAEHPLPQVLRRRLGPQPNREDRVREPLPFEDPQLPVRDLERRALSGQVGERQRAARLHVRNEREHLVESG